MSKSFRAAVLASVCWVAACGDGTPAEPQVDPATIVSTVVIRAPRPTLAVGTTMQLAADASNAAGTILVGAPIRWVSSRPDVASVTSEGLVTAVAAGTAVVSAASGRVERSVTLTVRAPNLITLTSESGDFIGGGVSYAYTSANAVISLSANLTTLRVSVGGRQRWNGTFQVPAGGQLTTGTFANALRHPFQGTAAGLDWSGEGRGCNTLTGSFTIDTLRWSNGPGSTVQAVDLRFEQRCEGAPPTLRGTIRWRADDPTVPPGPVVPAPNTLWRPAPGSVPATGDVVYLQSQPGDFVGGGLTSLFQSDIDVSGAGTTVDVEAGGFRGTFQGMNVIRELTVGFYGNLMRYPFHNSAEGGLTWFGNGRGCNRLMGWFAVDRVRYANGVLTGIELRFQQNCDGSTAALFGYVRWGQLSG
jgi:hypothetical protein